MNPIWQAVIGISMIVIAVFAAMDYYRQLFLTHRLDNTRAEPGKNYGFDSSGNCIEIGRGK